MESLQRRPLDPGRMDTTATKQQYRVEGALRPGGSLHYVGTRMVPASYPGTMRQHVRGRLCNCCANSSLCARNVTSHLVLHILLALLIPLLMPCLAFTCRYFGRRHLWPGRWQTWPLFPNCLEYCQLLRRVRRGSQY